MKHTTAAWNIVLPVCIEVYLTPFTNILQYAQYKICSICCINGVFWNGINWAFSWILDSILYVFRRDTIASCTLRAIFRLHCIFQILQSIFLLLTFLKRDQHKHWINFATAQCWNHVFKLLVFYTLRVFFAAIMALALYRYTELTLLQHYDSCERHKGF